MSSKVDLNFYKEVRNILLLELLLWMPIHVMIAPRKAYLRDSQLCANNGENPIMHRLTFHVRFKTFCLSHSGLKRKCASQAATRLQSPQAVTRFLFVYF